MGPFTKWLVQHAIEKFAEHELGAFTDGVYLEGSAPAASAVHLGRLQVRYAAIRTGLQPDVFENVLHFINTEAGVAGEILNDTKKGAVESAFVTFFTAVKTHACPYVALDSFRWYGVNFTDPLTGPPNRITDVTNVAGTYTGGFPAQVATSITMRTALRKHWGRIYFPGARVQGTDGLTDNASVDGMAAAFRTFVNSCAAANVSPVVYSRAAQAAMSVSAIEVDNVPDVVRRRRPKSSTYQKIYTS